MLKLALNAVSFIPGIGPAIGIAGNLVSVLLSCRPCLCAIAALALFVTGDIRGHVIERKHCSARIAADHKLAEAAAQARDAKAAELLDAKYRPRLAELERVSADNQKQVHDYEQMLLAEKSGGACELGVGALRLRTRSR